MQSNLHYNYYRTYNPLIGRYIQSDPIGLAAGFNTYNYVEGNPLGATDSLGLDKNRIQFSLQGGKSWDSNIDILNSILTFIGNNTTMKWEEKKKKRFPDNENLLTIGGHASIESLAGYSSEQIADMIIKGEFIMKDKTVIFNSFFKDRIKNNSPINITLEACDTGIITKSGYSFAGSVVDRLRTYAKNNNSLSKINVSAPNGLSYYNHITGKESVMIDNDVKARYKSIPNVFNYKNF